MKAGYYYIKELSVRSRIPISTIRFYGKSKILAPESRSEGGYRIYTVKSLNILNVIKTLKKHDFTLSEISDCVKGVRSNSELQNKLKKGVKRKIKSVRALASKYTSLIKKLQNLPSYIESKGYSNIDGK